MLNKLFSEFTFLGGRIGESLTQPSLTPAHLSSEMFVSAFAGFMGGKSRSAMQLQRSSEDADDDIDDKDDIERVGRQRQHTVQNGNEEDGGD